MNTNSNQSSDSLSTSSSMGVRALSCLLLWVLVCSGCPLWAQENQPLWPLHSKANADSAQIPSVLIYRPAPDKANGAAVLICPSGAYGFLAINQEGLPCAKWLNTLGVTAFILQYRHGTRHPHPQEQMSTAARFGGFVNRPRP